MRRLPPGPNVGTQLRARRAAKTRALRAEQEQRAAIQRKLRGPQQLALPTPDGWFAAQGQTPFPFQREIWDHVAAGRSGLLHATTGAGKTYAVWFGLLGRLLAEGRTQRGPLRLLWITPMRALSADTVRALRAPLEALGLSWEVEARTGDTDAAARARQSQRLPEVLVTTPESLSLLLTRADARALFAQLEMVVVDEWHELLGNKRGVQVQLALARLRRFAAARALTVWALSATLGNLEHAQDVLLGPGRDGVIVRGRIDKTLVADTLLPDDPGASPGAATSVSRWSSRWCARSPHTPRRWSSPTRARRPSSGTRHCSRRSRHGRGNWRCIMGRSIAKCATGSSSGSRKAASRRSLQPRAWISASTSCRSSACCRSAAPRASHDCCSARGAAATRPGGCPASRSYRRTPSS